MTVNQTTGQTSKFLNNEILRSFSLNNGPNKNSKMTKSMIQEVSSPTGLYVGSSSFSNSPAGSLSSLGGQMSSSYTEQWHRLFNVESSEGLLMYLKELGIHGHLRNCHFRSICWRLYLGVLSPNRSNWEAECRAWRNRYEDIRRHHIIDPHSDATKQDDPLSQHESSIWCRYFKGESERHQISQDVMRTFPELKFFHDDEVQSRLVRILYCYSQISPLSYKQGMHEVLAPLVFVLHSDQLDLSQAHEQGSVPDDVYREALVLIDADYVEHDAFALFYQIMQLIGRWYEVRETSMAPYIYSKPSVDKPFQNLSSYDQSLQQKGTAVEHLSDIHESLLKHNDLELYLHMERLEIAPQMYGLRWLRLLFGREFPLQDLLVLWDTIFAVGSNIILADYIYVAMLMEIRRLLLQGDFASCLCLMMRYPPGVDVNNVLKVALHLYQPMRYPRPQDKAFGGAVMYRSVSAVTTESPQERNHASTTLPSGTTSHGQNSTTVSGVTSKISRIASFNFSSKKSPPRAQPESIGQTAISQQSDANSLLNYSETLADVQGGLTKSDSVSLDSASMHSSRSRELMPLNLPRDLDGEDSGIQTTDKTDAERKLDEMQAMCLHCAGLLRNSSTKMASYLDSVHTDDSVEAPAEVKQLQMALAGVKQALYILSGNLQYEEKGKHNSSAPTTT